MLNIKKYFKPSEIEGADPEAVAWLEEHRADIAYTPDIWKLEQYIRQAVFLPCDLKTTGKNHHLIKDAINGPVYEYTYTSRPYTLWQKDLGGHSFPVALSADYRPDAYTIVEVEAAPIQGELLFIPGSTFKVLDKHRENGVKFYRDRVDIRVPYRTVSFSKERPISQISNHSYFTTVSAWMYFGVQSYWDPMIGGIFKSQMDLHQHDAKRVWIDKFYRFETG